MSKENVIGLVLIAVILFGYSIWMAPSEEERAESSRRRDSIALVRELAEQERLRRQQELEEQAAIIDTAALADVPEGVDYGEMDTEVREQLAERLGAFAPSGTGTESLITVKNEQLALTLNTLGGHIHSVELREYRTSDQRPLMLFKGEEDEFAYHFFSGTRSISTRQLFFSPYFNGKPLDTEHETLQVEGGEKGIFSMRAYTEAHSPGNPSYIEFAYGIPSNGYMIDYDVRFVGTTGAIAPNTTFLTLDWQVKLPRQEKNRTNEQNNSTVFYRYMSDEVSRLRETRDGSERLITTVQWISFKQQFFSSVIISGQGFSGAEVSSETLDEDEEDYLKRLEASMTLPYDPRQDNHYDMQFYFGPNHYQSLRAYQLDLERQIPLGWGFFLMSWINRYAVIPVFNFLDGFNLNYGIIILILTVLLKLVLMPIAFKTYTSQAKMRALKPEIDELGKKYPKKEDAMKKQQATMALYKKAGVNPMSGCVPMLLQLPILLSMFRFFPASIELRQEAFLWADDLSAYDSILDLPFTIPFYGDHVSLFTILMTVSTIFYTRINSKMMGSSQQMPGMKTMMYFMPVMLMGIFNNFASGLSYYYFLANVITFGQMYLFRQFVNEDALRRKIEENKKKPVKKSKWAQRMEALAKQQQEMQKGQKRKKK